MSYRIQRNDYPQFPYSFTRQESVLTYTQYKVITRTETEEMISPKLPVLTLCPKVPFKKGPLLKFLREFDETRNESKWKNYPVEAAQYLDSVVRALFHNETM